MSEPHRQRSILPDARRCRMTMADQRWGDSAGWGGPSNGGVEAKRTRGGGSGWRMDEQRRRCGAGRRTAAMRGGMTCGNGGVNRIENQELERGSTCWAGPVGGGFVDF